MDWLMKGEQIENEHLLSIADDFYQLCDSCHPYLYKKCAADWHAILKE
ncbi:hypothetical protein [Aerococcus urinaeequi]